MKKTLFIALIIALNGWGSTLSAAASAVQGGDQYISQIHANISTLDNRVTKLEDDFDESVKRNSSSFNNLQNHVTRNESTIAQIEKTIQGLETIDKKHDAAIAGLTEADKKHDTAIAGLTEADKKYDTAIAGLTEADKKHDTAIAGLTEADKKYDTAIAGLTEADKKHDAAIEKLDDRSGTNKFAITELKKNKVDKADYELDKKNFDEKLDKEIDDRKAHSKIFDKRTKDNQKNIEANKQAIAGLTEADKKHDAAIAQTNDKVDVIDNRVAAAEGSIVEHGKTLESHTNKLATISTTVDRHAVEIDELKQLHSSGMQNINNRINKMDKKLERGLASNAALAGLMQPYNVGKFNVTVGMGGYRSTTAIAAGAGYRFSNSVAVRAGLATDTQDFSDLTYNMSASFEF